MSESLFASLRPKHYMAPCHKQPGRQRWHLRCALRHPVTFLRTRSVIDTDLARAFRRAGGGDER